MAKQRSIPRVKTYMSMPPYTIGDDQTMARAHEVMRQHRVRHLPVLRAQKLVGVVSDGDLHMVETLAEVDPRKVRVDEAMTQDVYTVSPDAPLDEVVREMATHKYGSVIVVDHGHVVGVFTTVDACRAFADMLHTHLG
jgi:acetoin utilization protein AcuB